MQPIEEVAEVSQAEPETEVKEDAPKAQVRKRRLLEIQGILQKRLKRSLRNRRRSSKSKRRKSRPKRKGRKKEAKICKGRGCSSDGSDGRTEV